MKNRGFLSVSVGLVMLAAIGLAAAGFMYTYKANQRNVYQKLDRLEGFYTNEVAQWNGFERYVNNLDAGIAPGPDGYPSNLQNTYTALSSTINPHYRAESPPGTPYGLSATRKFDDAVGNGGTLISPQTSSNLNRRLAPGKLFYKISP